MPSTQLARGSSADRLMQASRKLFPQKTVRPGENKAYPTLKKLAGATIKVKIAE
jgi:hypothetical protein